MATRTTYYPLVENRGYLKWLLVLATVENQGITQTDLTAAELWARDKVNLWLVKVCGPTRGATLITEFLNAANPLDPGIQHIAQIIASARISQTWEDRNFDNQGADLNTKRRTCMEILQEALDMMREIRMSGYLVKADGTVRRLRLGNLMGGPVVGGPMSADSLFNDTSLFTDVHGVSRVTPHTHPIDEAT